MIKGKYFSLNAYFETYPFLIAFAKPRSYWFW